MDSFTLNKLAGHTDLNTTMRYVHLNDDDVRAAAMAKAQGGHKTINETLTSRTVGKLP
jgi:integrase